MLMEDQISQIYDESENADVVSIEPVTKVTQEEWLKMKRDLLLLDEKQSHCISQTLNYKEMVVENKLDRLRREMFFEDPVLVTAPHYEKLQKLLNSPLFDCLKMMPKPAIHHTHATATADVEFLIGLTYNDFVYYSEKENLFFTSKKGCD
jgi:hypothetical protein